ncbi:MAG: preprotein translocase subunit YajC [Bacteroidetes bacterium]|nr:preprotein translocase subunit YajC [Bacteroidota bacterium]
MQNTILAINSGTMNMIMILLMFVVMYFFMILPQMKKGKAQKKFWGELKKGDHIVTSGGIHGKITELKDTTVIIEVESGVKIKIEKSSISLELSQAAQK